MASIPSNWKNCATCSHWCGKQTPDVFCANVQYDQMSVQDALAVDLTGRR